MEFPWFKLGLIYIYNELHHKIKYYYREGFYLKSMNLNNNLLSSKKPFNYLIKQYINNSSIRFHPDGHLIGAGSNDGKITIWNVVDDSTVATLEGHNVIKINK